ncbi:MAG: hypothetical protein ACK5HL_03685 [Bacilli bacterium]
MSKLISIESICNTEKERQCKKLINRLINEGKNVEKLSFLNVEAPIDEMLDKKLTNLMKSFIHYYHL